MTMLSNKYNLQLRSNTYRLPTQQFGNGLSGVIIEQCVNNVNFLIYPLYGNFYCYIGSENNRKFVTKRSVELEDLMTYWWNDAVIIRYATEIIDEYLSNGNI